jgi:hypothetical protein
MATQKLLYTAPAAFTLSAASVVNGSAREGTIITNTANLYIDDMLSGKSITPGTVALADQYILLSSSDGTQISYPATGTDSTLVLLSAQPRALASLDTLQYGQLVPGTSLIYAYKIPMAGVAVSTAIPFTGIYVANAFGGNIPYGGWAPVLVNLTGSTNNATAGNFVFNETGLQYTIA